MKFKKANLDLKLHINSLYTIENPLYFHKMDTIEKFYWFGFLCADGGLYNGRITFALHAHDYDRIIKFAKAIGFDLSRIRDIWSKPNYYKTKSGEIHIYPPSPIAMVQFGCKEMYKQLRDELRMVTSGQKNKDVPSIIKNLIGEAKRQSSFWYDTLTGKKAIAWLLGYFDGDGEEGSSRIYSNSYKFLYQIKKKFRLNSKISKQKYMTKDGVEKTRYMMFLTADLFNEMLYNYDFSLRRKRIKLIDSKLRVEQLERARAMRREKFMFSREQLQILLFKMPKIQIAKLHRKKFGIEIGRTTIDRYARKWGVKMPPAYYWTGKKFLGNLDDYL
ncbi:hypothetical protein ES703_68157 [subsurface metagenome]